MKNHITSILFLGNWYGEVGLFFADWNNFVSILKLEMNPLTPMGQRFTGIYTSHMIETGFTHFVIKKSGKFPSSGTSFGVVYLWRALSIFNFHLCMAGA